MDLIGGRERADRTSSPRTPGHEIIGEVAAVPSSEKRWKIGDRVGGGWHGGHDGTCKNCARGFNQTCVAADINGVTMDGGCNSLLRNQMLNENLLTSV